MRTGVDLGGTKIEAVVIDHEDQVLARNRVLTPKGDYDGIVGAIADLVASTEREAGGGGEHIGVGVPGSPAAGSGLMRNCNSTVLNGKLLGSDLTRAIGREIRLTNDANCLALSEAWNGAGQGAASVFAIILGTGVGGGVVVGGVLHSGVNGVAGEWGHIPLPWPTLDESPGPRCWCGRHGCLETWLSGPAIEEAWVHSGGEPLPATDIASQYADSPLMTRWLDRLARATAVIIDIVDPEVLVIGGGLSRIEAIYTEVPLRWPSLVFSDSVQTRVVPAMHGDSSGVFGAARL
ncbi:MAG: ROK family protein [Planctomycetes bacterium]|nr:ROK family protein [Planctomycetota bacterium]MCP4839094.1 ROK family protein [Planctomycetota bacterium]